MGIWLSTNRTAKYAAAHPRIFVFNGVMEFNANVTYDGSVADAVKVLMSQELADARAKALEISDYAFESGEHTAVIRFAVKQHELPDVAKNFLRNGAKAAIKATLHPTQNKISHEVELPGIPASVSFDINVTEHAGKTRAEFTGEVQISIPLLGKKLENMVVGEVAGLLAEDAELVNALL